MWNNSTKKQKKLFISMCAAAITIFIGSSIYAVVTMQVVPQKIGIPDVKFSSLKKSSCAGCHGESLVDQHHGTKAAAEGKCDSCHKVYSKAGKTKVLMSRNCMKCHITSPHHATQNAVDKKCTECHDSPGVSQFSMKVPSYKASAVTPTRSSCKNCHKNGVLDKQNISSIKDTHHEIGLKGCDTCHVEQKNSEDVRVCERCHSAAALHEVKPHVEKGICTGCHVMAAKK